MKSQFVWDSSEHTADAIAGSKTAILRLQGMKARAQVDPARAAVGGFPYPARTCAEWAEAEA